MKTGRIVAATAVVAAVGVVGPIASAATPKPGTDTTTNWAGYTVVDSAATPVSFTFATATWKQPALTCGAGASRTAIWVGLGGATGSQDLEQLGTDSDCAAGKAQYAAFYDVVPNPGGVVKRFPIRAGDILAVTVSTAQGGADVRFRMENVTRKLVFSGSLPVPPGERHSAEWIVEAPSGCNNVACEQADLANFGTVSFTKVATVGNGHSGTILDPRWHATADSLRPALSQIVDTGLSHGAAPEALAGNGSSFEVEWLSHTAIVTHRTNPKPPAAKPAPYIAGPREASAGS